MDIEINESPLPEHDGDLTGIDIEAAVREIVRLRNVIRWHRDQGKDDPQERCFLDDYLLYMCLPEKQEPVIKEVTEEEWMKGCEVYCKSFYQNRVCPLLKFVKK